jgi:hypothetical protein
VVSFYWQSLPFRNFRQPVVHIISAPAAHCSGIGTLRGIKGSELRICSIGWEKWCFIRIFEMGVRLDGFLKPVRPEKQCNVAEGIAQTNNRV